MPGTAALARETGAPIVPLALWGMQRIALGLDEVPRTAVPPSWGPPSDPPTMPG